MTKYFITLILLCVSFIYSKNIEVKNMIELKSAIKKALPGDFIVMKNGEWKDAWIIFNSNGTKEKEITLISETPGQVILSGNSALRIAGDYLVVDGLTFKDGYIDKGSVIEFRNGSKSSANYSRLTNTVIQDYNPPDKTTDYKWVSLYGSHNRIDHCYFRNKIHQGCLLVVWLSESPNYHLIDSNYFAYRPELGNNGGEIIRVGTSDWAMYPSHTTVEYNYFEQCNGEREIISNKSVYNTYRYNTFVECQGSLTLRHGNYCEVYGNYFFGNGVEHTGGVRIIGEGHKVYNNYFQDLTGTDAFSALSIMNGVPNSPLNRYYQVKNAVVVFNTFINCKNSIEIGIGKNEELTLPPINSVIANNIIYSKYSPIIKYIDKPLGFEWVANIYYGAELGVDIKEGIELKDVRMEKLDEIFRPENIDAVSNKSIGNYEFVVDDIDGQTRGLEKSIGCDEPSANRKLRSVMSKLNTGPN